MSETTEIVSLITAPIGGAVPLDGTAAIVRLVVVLVLLIIGIVWIMRQSNDEDDQ